MKTITFDAENWIDKTGTIKVRANGSFDFAGERFIVSCRKEKLGMIGSVVCPGGTVLNGFQEDNGSWTMWIGSEWNGMSRNGSTIQIAAAKLAAMIF